MLLEKCAKRGVLLHRVEIYQFFIWWIHCIAVVISELIRSKTGKCHHCVLAKKAERQTEIAYLCAEGMSIEQIAFWQGRIRIWKVASLKLSFSFILKVLLTCAMCLLAVSFPIIYAIWQKLKPSALSYGAQFWLEISRILRPPSYWQSAKVTFALRVHCKCFLHLHFYFNLLSHEHLWYVCWGCVFEKKSPHMHLCGLFPHEQL